MSPISRGHESCPCRRAIHGRWIQSLKLLAYGILTTISGFALLLFDIHLHYRVPNRPSLGVHTHGNFFLNSEGPVLPAGDQK